MLTTGLVIAHSEPEHGQLREDDLPEYEGILVVDGVEPVTGDHFGPELLPDGVGGQAVHVHLHVRPDLLVRQELAGNDLECREWR